MKLKETYNISHEDMQKFMQQILHPSLEDAIMSEKKMEEMCSHIQIIRREGGIIIETCNNLDLSFLK